MIGEQVDAEGVTEGRDSRQAAANATDDGMRIAEDDDEKAVELMHGTDRIGQEQKRGPTDL